MVTAAPAVFEGPLSVANPSAVAALRDVLDRHGFTGAAAVEALGPPLPFGKGHLRDDLPFYLRRVEAPTPLNTLIRLFVLGSSVDRDLAVHAFAPLALDDVIELGVIESGPGGISARLRLSMYEDLLIAHDAYNHDQDKRTLRPDHVLDVNPTTISLSNLTVRRRVARALEIGTGCGALALRARLDMPIWWSPPTPTSGPSTSRCSTPRSTASPTSSGEWAACSTPSPARRSI